MKRAGLIVTPTMRLGSGQARRKRPPSTPAKGGQDGRCTAWSGGRQALSAEIPPHKHSRLSPPRRTFLSTGERR